MVFHVYPDPNPKGIVARQNLSSSGAVGNTETTLYTQTFYALAGRSYEIHFRISAVGTSAGDGTAYQSGRTICRWASGTTVSPSDTFLGDVYTAVFVNDLSRASGVDVSFDFSPPSSGLVTVGISLYALRSPAATYGSVRYSSNAQSALLIKDIGATPPGGSN
jgi:hypothetical protein